MSGSRFAGKTAIVTGAASGIGLAIARRFQEEGANVVVADLPNAVEKLRASNEGGGARMIASPCDVTQDTDIERCCQLARDTFGSIDVLVNNAGAMIFKPIVELTRADWLKQLDVNVLGAAMFIRFALPMMKEGSSIVNVASVHARQTTANVAAYAAAKAALDSLTRSASIENRDRRIRVNAILPGAVDTPMFHASPNIRSGVEKYDSRDLASPVEIAAAVAFLASDEATFVNGTSFTVDGGRLSKL